MQTVHWGIIGTFVTPLASAIASNFCGHNIDLSTISWTAEGSSILVTIFGFLAAHTNLFTGNSNSTPDPLAVQ
ncbi:MAG: hypothetical protein KGI08_10400 [Thaumarchaeota archaeon]|nr:hypothetical protein [Nitrososphaerota archaeon]